MMLSVYCLALVSLALLSSTVIGDPTHVLVVTSAEVTNYPNDYCGPWVIDIFETKKSSLITFKTPVQKELPLTTMVKISAQLTGQEVFDYSISLCDAWDDPVIGGSILSYGIPKETFPKSCPINPGDWVVLKWNPPVEKIPPGVPSGEFSGVATVGPEDEEPFMKVEFTGQLTHSMPGFGR